MFTLLVTLGTVLMIGPDLTEQECRDVGTLWSAKPHTHGLVQCAQHEQGQNYKIVWEKRW
jgi:hypothetical protein